MSFYDIYIAHFLSTLLFHSCLNELSSFLTTHGDIAFCAFVLYIGTCNVDDNFERLLHKTKGDGKIRETSKLSILVCINPHKDLGFPIS